MVAFHDDHRSSVSLDVATTPIPPNRLRVSAGLVDGDGLQPIVMSAVEEERLPDHQGVLLSSTFAPRAGVFRAGEIVDVTTIAEFDEPLGEDLLVVSTPTKVVTMRVVLHDPPVPLPPALLTIARVPDGEVVRTESVPVRLGDDGAAEFFVAVHYPDAGTMLSLRWARAAAVALTTADRPKLELAR
jgi:hypothetical protein